MHRHPALQDVKTRLAIIRGCCELARLKQEHGPALEQRMTIAIEAVDQVADLLTELCHATGQDCSD